MAEIGSEPPELLEGDVEDELDELPRMTLIGHLDELRKRIIRSVLVVLVAFFGCWGFSKEIYRFLAVPVMAVLPEGKKLVFLSVTEPFFLYVKVAALAGTVVLDWSFLA